MREFLRNLVLSHVNKRFTKTLPEWSVMVRGLRQSVYFLFPVYEMSLSAQNLRFSTEFREDLRICRYLDFQTLRNEYFKYIISKYGFFWPGECIFELGGYIELECELVLESELTFREAAHMMRIMYKKYLRNFLVAYQESPDKIIRGDVVSTLIPRLQADDYGYLFTRQVKSINGRRGEWTNIGQMIREIRRLGPESQILRVRHSCSSNNSSQFILNLKPPKTEEELKAEEELDRRIKLRGRPVDRRKGQTRAIQKDQKSQEEGVCDEPQRVQGLADVTSVGPVEATQEPSELTGGVGVRAEYHLLLAKYEHSVHRPRLQ